MKRNHRIKKIKIASDLEKLSHRIGLDTMYDKIQVTNLNFCSQATQFFGSGALHLQHFHTNLQMHFELKRANFNISHTSTVSAATSAKLSMHCSLKTEMYSSIPFA